MTNKLSIRPGFDLEAIQGWYDINNDKRIEIRRAIEANRSARNDKGFAVLKEMETLDRVRQLSEESRGFFTNFLKTSYGKSAQSAYGQLEQYADAKKVLTQAQIEFLSARGLELMPYRSMRFGDVVLASKELPKLRAPDEKALEAWAIKVGEKYVEMQKEWRKGGKKVDSDTAMKICFKYILRCLKMAHLKNTTDQRDWLLSLIGMVFHERAIPAGGAKLVQVEVPAAYRTPRGRPKKTTKKAA